MIRFYTVMQGYDYLRNGPGFQVVGLVLLVSESTLQHNVRKIRKNGEGMTCISQLPMAWITAKMPSSKSVSFSSFSWPFLMMMMIWNLIALTLTSSKNVQERLLGNDWCWYKHILLSDHQFYVATKFPYYCGTTRMPITFCLLPWRCIYITSSTLKLLLKDGFQQLVSEQRVRYLVYQNNLGIVLFSLLSVFSTIGRMQMLDWICWLVYTNLKKQYVSNEVLLTLWITVFEI